MKKTHMLMALLFVLNNSFAQQDLITELLGIKYNYKTFNLKGNVEQLNYQKGLKDGMGVISGYNYKNFFDNKGNLTYVTYYKYKADDDDRNNDIYMYNDKNQLIEINTFENFKPTKNYSFHYNDIGELTKINVSNIKANAVSNYTIEWENKKPIKFVLKEKDIKVYESFNHEFDKNNNITKYEFNDGEDLGMVTKIFDKNNNVIQEKYIYNRNSSYNFEIKSTYKKDNDIITKVEDGETVNYNYSNYDQQNNWKKKSYTEMKLNTIESRELTYYK